MTGLKENHQVDIFHGNDQIGKANKISSEITTDMQCILWLNRHNDTK